MPPDEFIFTSETLVIYNKDYSEYTRVLPEYTLKDLLECSLS